MPLPIFLSGAMVSGFASGIWSYNRDNYMWDWQNRQSRDFQIQNIVISRFSLFREDIRDLAGLTTAKMDNYLVVNTLKLGFIVGAFFNYDRNDGPGNEGSPIERQFILLFSICFLSAFYLLLTSVWFSTHASVIAQAFMTKMLLTTVRIPFATDEEISQAAPEARDYEADLSTAFRIPFMGSASRRTSTLGQLQARSNPQMPTTPGPSRTASKQSDTSPTIQSMSSNLSRGLSAQVDSSLSSLAGTKSGRLQANPEDQELGGSPSSLQSMRSLPPPSMRSEESVVEEAHTPWQASLAPHLKFYSIVMSSWQPFDLYSKISMSIGTSCMLSGFAYFALFYTRLRPIKDNGFGVPPEGWCTFAFMEILAWWSLSLDLVLSRFEQMLSALLVVGAALTVFLFVHFESESISMMPPAVMVSKTLFVVLLCLSGLPHKDGWPRRWRASLFMNILGTRPSEQSEASSGEDMGLPTSASQLKSSRGSELAVRLLHVFGQIKQMPLPPPEAQQVHQVSLRLARMTGGKGGLDPPRDTGSNHPQGSDGGGFWVVTPSLDGDGKTQTSWVGTSARPEGKPPSAAERTTLEELMGVAHATLDSLRLETTKSWSWTPEDAEQLAAYGGQLDCEDVNEWESQFRPKRGASRSSMGKLAHRFFRASIIFVSIMWITGCYCCRLIGVSHLRSAPQHRLVAYFGKLADRAGLLRYDPAPADELARAVSSAPLVLPRPWYAPTSMSCSPDGRRLVLSDGVRAFATAANGSGWLGPFGACAGADVAAAAFAPAAAEEEEPELVGTGLHGALPLPRGGHSGAEHCDWAASGAASTGPQPSAAAPGPRLSLLALDSAPPLHGSTQSLTGLALKGSQLVALEPAAGGAWRLAGILPGPPRGDWEGRRWVGLALHAGVGLALDEGGAVYELDATTGDWSGPQFLEETGLSWRGICRLPSGGSGQWLAVGERTGGGQGAGGRARHSLEIWSFAQPPRGGAGGPGALGAAEALAVT